MDILIGTVYNNEFPSDTEGRISHLGRPLLPIEKSFIELVKCSGSDDKYPIPGKSYHCKDFSWSWRRCGGHFIADNRNSLVCGNSTNKPVSVNVKSCAGIDKFVFIDSDTGFTYDNILAGVKIDKAIYSGAYEWRTDSRCYTAGELDKNNVIRCAINKNSKGIKSCTFVGAGALFIKKEVFEELKYPWFSQYHENKNGMVRTVSDDISFCINVKKAGYDIFLDCDNIFPHYLIQGVNFMTKIQEVKIELCEMYINKKNHTVFMDQLNKKITAKEIELNAALQEEDKSKEVAKEEKSEKSLDQK